MIAKHFATSYQSGQESGIGYQAKQSGNMPVAQEQPLIRSRADLSAAVAEGLSVMEWNSTGKAAMELGEPTSRGRIFAH